MAKRVKAGNWDGMLVVLDSIPIQCPECGHQVSLQGGINEKSGDFELTPCPHCGEEMEIQILAGTEDGEDDEVDAAGVKGIEVLIGVKNMPTLKECSYHLVGMSSVYEILDRAINVLCNIFASPALDPNSIKNLYVRQLLSIFYTLEGKKQIVSELEAQIEKETKGN